MRRPTDYSRAACAGVDPDAFNDSGTPEARAACSICPIVTQCRDDALRQGTRGVYRGGVRFADFSSSGKLAARRDA